MNVRRVLLVSLIATAAILVGEFCFGQTPDFGGEVKTDSLTYRGVRANAQTKPENHTRNLNPNMPGWGGCVPSSVRTAALYAGVPRDQIDHFWEIAQRKVGRGGTDPELLASMLNEAMPDEKWISYVGNDPTVLDKLSAKGYLLCGTMAWGRLYGNQTIAHMVNYPHYSSADDLACLEDNNDPPGVYRWFTATEAAARVFHGGQGWVFAFTRLPFVAQVAVSLLVLAAALLLLASSLMLAGWQFLRPV